MNSRRLAGVALLVVLLAGGWVRFVQLGEPEFWTDELNHHYVARSIAAGEGPTLPSGHAYLRGLAISNAIAWIQPRVEDPELAARLPGAIFGLLGLFLIAAIAWTMGGPWAAVWATLLLASYPEAIAQSRNARFYTLQLDLGLVALFSGWMATRETGFAGVIQWSESTVARWTWMAVAVTTLYAAYRLQPTTLTVAVAFGTWIGALALAAFRRQGWRAITTDMPTQVCVLVLVAGTGLWIAGVAEPLLSMWWGRAQWAATWVPEDARRPTFYLHLLRTTLGWVLALLPVFVLVAYRRAPRLTLYLLTWLTVPLALHSAILEWKGARYFLVPLPALLILAGMALQDLSGLLRTAVSRYIAETRFPGALQISGALMLGAGLWAVFNLPSFPDFRRALNPVEPPGDWTLAGELLRSDAGTRSLPWASTNPLNSLHYWGRVDAGVQPGLLDYAQPLAPHHPSVQFPPEAGAWPRDFYTGVPVITTPEELRLAYAGTGAVVVGVDPSLETVLAPAMRAVLESEARELCQGRCGQLQLYLWTFGTAVGDDRQ